LPGRALWLVFHGAERDRLKPSELIKVLQEAVDAGCDDTTRILFDTEARTFNYHMAEIGTAYFVLEIDETPFISLHEKK
jgi:hypothetical protein